MNARQIDWARLERFVRREGTLEELSSDERWVQSDPALAALALAMSSIGCPPDAEPHDWDEQAIWQRIRRRMPWFAEAGRLAQVPRVAHRSRSALRGARSERRPVSHAVLAAASVLVVIGALFVTRSATGPSTTPASVPAPREIRTGPGQRAMLDLSDGTRATLGPESRLRIPASFQAGEGPREVELVGEGYFVVHHDSTRSFRVQTTAGIAEDLGTAFVVTAHPETRGMQVVVTEGVVALRRIGSGATAPPLVTLTRGNLARLDSSGTATVTTVVNPSAYAAWTSGEIRFDGTPLRDALPVLSRWYGLDLRLGDAPLADRRITASFTDKSPDEVLDALSLLLRLRLDRSGDSITLRAR
jgi:transmembrane sensor